MTLRTSTESNYARVLFGLRVNQARLVHSQAQVASGSRILRPSDDPAGATRALSLTRRLAAIGSQRSAAESGRASLDQAAAALQETSGLLTQARELFLQGMNGTLTPEDREAIATELEELRDALIDLGNTQVGERYAFAGTLSDKRPWVEASFGDLTRVLYAGNDEELSIAIGPGADVAVNVPGSAAFGRFEATGTVYAGLTGIAGGLTADEGTGYEYLELRHDATLAGDLGTVGLALVAGGAGDTILGDQTLVVDPIAGTVQLGSGPVRELPDPSQQNAADFVVANEQGGELHLDFSAYTGAAFNGVVTGEGSISIDGTSFVPLSFTETDLELKHAATGTTLHVDATAVGRAGRELVHFAGAVNTFDALQGMIDDLRSDEALAHPELLQRMNLRLAELDRNHGNATLAMGVLGARSARVQDTDQRLAGVDLQLQGFLSDTKDADLSEAVLELAMAEQTLQLAQASGLRLIQTSLLNFLR